MTPRHCWIAGDAGGVCRVVVMGGTENGKGFYCMRDGDARMHYVEKSALRPAPDAKIIESPAGQFFVCYGNERAAHGPFMSHALALAYASRASHTDDTARRALGAA